MRKILIPLFLAVSALPALAQVSPDPYQQGAQNQAQINQTLQQTQQNNAAMQLQVEQNQQLQQQQLNAMPVPGYQQRAYQLQQQPPASAPPRPLTPQP